MYVIQITWHALFRVDRNVQTSGTVVYHSDLFFVDQIVAMNVSCLPHSFNSLCHARKSKSGSSCLCFEMWNYPLGIFMFRNIFLDWNVTQHLLIRIQNGYECSAYGPWESIKEPNHCIIKLHMHGKQSMGFSNHHISWKEKGNTNLWDLWVQSLFPFRSRRCKLNYILCSAYLALHQHSIFCVIHNTEINVPWRSVVFA